MSRLLLARPQDSLLRYCLLFLMLFLSLPLSYVAWCRMCDLFTFLPHILHLRFTHLFAYIFQCVILYKQTCKRKYPMHLVKQDVRTHNLAFKKWICIYIYFLISICVCMVDRFEQMPWNWKCSVKVEAGPCICQPSRCSDARSAFLVNVVEGPEATSFNTFEASGASIRSPTCGWPLAHRPLERCALPGHGAFSGDVEGHGGSVIAIALRYWWRVGPITSIGCRRCGIGFCSILDPRRRTCIISNGWRCCIHCWRLAREHNNFITPAVCCAWQRNMYPSIEWGIYSVRNQLFSMSLSENLSRMLMKSRWKIAIKACSQSEAMRDVAE